MPRHGEGNQVAAAHAPLTMDSVTTLTTSHNAEGKQAAAAHVQAAASNAPDGGSGSGADAAAGGWGSWLFRRASGSTAPANIAGGGSGSGVPVTLQGVSSGSGSGSDLLGGGAAAAEMYGGLG
jgi:hypothetical protein